MKGVIEMSHHIKERIIVFLFPILLALPFLNRAYFVDDSYFVQIGSWLKDNPGQPYHFRADDAGINTRGWEEDGLVRMVNPLVHHYYLAILMKTGSNKEWFLRLGCVLLSCFAALFLFGLARRLTENPFLATLLVLVTPVHWLTSYSLLIDSTLSFFFFGGLYFFIKAIEKDHIGTFVISGIFMGLGILTKYPGVFVLPLTALWTILRWKKIGHRWRVGIPWVLALVFLGAFNLWTMKLYGQAHILAASQRMVHLFGWAKPFVFLVFLSGVCFFPVFIWKLTTKKMILFGGFIVSVVMIIFSSSLGGFSLFQGFLYGFFFASSILFLIHMGMIWKKYVFPRDFFLVLWILGFVLMMMVVMGWVAARYYMIVVPAVVFLTIRFIEMEWRGHERAILKGLLAFALFFTSLLAYADYKQADPSRDVGSKLTSAGYAGGAGHYYMGDSFTMAYLRSEGWIPWFPGTEFEKGDRILTKTVTMPPIYRWREKVDLKLIKTFEYNTRYPLKVMDFRGSAGFYASLWGGLPFSFSTGPWERFVLFEVVGIKTKK
ncbi:hypothetical protein BVX98_00760 [bacterium F11]|nr:hypothetical protein BVX98_00760 [bacterium F11]